MKVLMNEKEIELLNKAYEQYNLDLRPDLEKDVLNYIYSRFEANRDAINSLIDICTDTEYTITYDQLDEVFRNELDGEFPYKTGTPLTRYDNGFAKGSYLTSIGPIVIEVSDPLKVLKVMIKAIKTRNAICISDYYFNEVSINSALLIIFCEAIAKFNIDRNLIMILPPEDCFIEEFDNRILLEDDMNEVIKPGDNNIIYIYEQDEVFDDEVNKQIKSVKDNNLEAVLEKGDSDEVINKINKEHPICAVIYTTNSMEAYKFINLVHSTNVFVNASPLNYENGENISNPFLKKKTFIYPFKYGIDEEENKEQSAENNIKNHPEEQALIQAEINPWYKKILKKIISFFK